MTNLEVQRARLGMRLFLAATPRLYPGKRVGEWTLLTLHPGQGPVNAMWTCRCDCGNVVDVRASNLKTATSRSCGHETYGRPRQARKTP